MNPQEQLFDVIATRTGTAVDGPFRSLDAAADIANRMNIQAAHEGRPVQYVAQVRDPMQGWSRESKRIWDES